MHEELARTCRVAAVLGLLDLMGHVSARTADGLVVTTPSFREGSVLPRSCGATDLLVVDLDGAVVSGRGELPFDIDVDLAVYRARTDVNAVVSGAPETAVAFGIAGEPVLPLAHSQSRNLFAGVVRVELTELPTTRAHGDDLARQLGKAPILTVAGIGVTTVGRTLIEALERLDGYEYLARLTLLTRRVNESPRVVTRAESDSVVAERPVEKVPSRDPRRYYDSLDPLGSPSTTPAVVAAGPETSTTQAPEQLRAAIAITCRILAAQGDLAYFKEHVSHRTADDDRYLMSPAKTFAHMTADDVGEIGMEGDCEWLSGPYPPAPFRWYHRDLFRARPDVNAIVHTHELYGRAVPLAGGVVEPIFRNGAVGASSPLAVFAVPTLAFREDHRQGILTELGSGSTVHLLSHGTDYVADTLEQALTAAIHREQISRLYVMASEVGRPRALAPQVVEQLAAVTPTAAAWWAYYAAAVPGVLDVGAPADRADLSATPAG
jgi:L-fuculose-phosphate aldolase